MTTGPATRLATNKPRGLYEMDGKIRVAAIDASPTFLRALSVLFGEVAEDIELVAAAPTTEEGLPLVIQSRPAIVMADAASTRPDGRDAILAIREMFPWIRWVVLTDSSDPRDVRRAMNLGTSGVLLRSTQGEELVAAIRAIQAGHCVLSDFACSTLLGDAGEPLPALTPEEMRILSLLGEGLTEVEAARRVAVSTSTLKRQLQAAQDKLRAQNRVDAIVRAVRKGLI